jgi:hypothetical protein
MRKPVLIGVKIRVADQTGREVYGMNRLPLLEHCNRESHSRHDRLCVRLFCVCIVLCVVSDLATV